MESLNLIREKLQQLMALGGVAIVVIAALSVMTLAIIMRKVFRLIRLGAWAASSTCGA